MSKETKAAFALLGTIFLWAYMAVLARGVVTVISPVTVLFYRLLIASLFFLPFFIRGRVWKKLHFRELLLVSLGSTINLTFFTIGLKYTSASVSQLLYAAMPILILIYSRVIYNERQSAKKILGVILGFAGLVLIGIMSAVEKGETITGSLLGNLLILVAMFGWTTYLINSKKLSKHFSPTEMGSTSILLSFLFSIVLVIFTDVLQGKSLLVPVGFLLPLFYIGFAATFLTYILYQYAIRHSSALKVSLASYIQPVVTTMLAMFFLGETLTLHFVIGSVLILSGVFLTSSVR